MAKKVVVFGGSGFLGSHVADSLTKKGFNVVIYDCKKSPYLNNKQKMVVGDILDLAKVKNTIQGAQYVYNFSGIADIQEAKNNPINTVKYNILGTTHVLESCRQYKVKRFIFASSLYVYSNLGSFYRSSKQACELLIDDYHQKFGLDYTILRFGSLYGDRANEFNFIRRIITQALTEGQIIQKGDGEEIREYINVLDAARCSVEILSEDFRNECVMITGTQTTKIKELLGMIKEMTGNRTNLRFTPEKIEDHYDITPYAFRPKVARKFISNYYLDLGEGLLDLLYQTHEELTHSRRSIHKNVVVHNGSRKPRKKSKA